MFTSWMDMAYKRNVWTDWSLATYFLSTKFDNFCLFSKTKTMMFSFDCDINFYINSCIDLRHHFSEWNERLWYFPLTTDVDTDSMSLINMLNEANLCSSWDLNLYNYYFSELFKKDAFLNKATINRKMHVSNWKDLV